MGRRRFVRPTALRASRGVAAGSQLHRDGCRFDGEFGDADAGIGRQKGLEKGGIPGVGWRIADLWGFVNSAENWTRPHQEYVRSGNCG